MVLFPEVQKKGQAEVDAVIGPNRLPDFEDRAFLPYVNAIVKESMRWQLVAPLGGFFFIVMVTTILTGSKLLATWLLTMMNTMVILFQKGQLCSVVHGQY